MALWLIRVAAVLMVRMTLLGSRPRARPMWGCLLSMEDSMLLQSSRLSKEKAAQVRNIMEWNRGKRKSHGCDNLKYFGVGLSDEMWPWVQRPCQPFSFEPHNYSCGLEKHIYPIIRKVGWAMNHIFRSQRILSFSISDEVLVERSH